MPISEAYNMDCMDYMAQFPDKHFELAIVDPPYGIGRSGQKETFTIERKHKRKFFDDRHWDKSAPEDLFFDELKRVTVNQIVWGANYFTQHLPASMGWVFWDKGQTLSMSDGELAFTSFQRALRRVVINRGRLFIEGGTIHPTQKPVALYKWLLTNYAKSGDKILDTHLGSGSSRIAAWDLGFDFYATELDKDYFDAQEKRFADHIAQPNMFAETEQKAEQSTLNFASDG